MTRIIVLILILTLCGTVIYSDVRGTNFDPIFKLFSDVTLMVASFFFGKSSSQQATTITPDTTTTTSQVLPG